MIKIFFVFATVFQLITNSASAVTWSTETVDRAAPGNRMTQIKIDKNGTAHLIYTGCSDSKCANSELFYAIKNSAGVWQTNSIDSEGQDTGWFPSFVIDAMGLTHLFYANHDKQSLRYAKQTMLNGKVSWSVSNLGEGRGGWWTSSAIAGNTIWLAHTRLAPSGWDNVSLEVVRIENGNTSVEIVDNRKSAGWLTSMALDLSGMPYVTYNRSISFPVGDLMLAHKTSTGWEITGIDGAVTKNNMVTDAQGYVHIVYTKASSIEGKHDLKYVTNAPDGKFKKSVIAAATQTMDTGYFPNIAIDQNGRQHVVYQEYSGSLRYSRMVNEKWEESIIDNMGVNVYPWITADTAGVLHLSYEKMGTIVYGTCSDCIK